MGGPSLLSFLTPASHLPMGILACSGSGHRRNLSRNPSPPPSSQRQEVTPAHGRAQSLWLIPISHAVTPKGLSWILSPYMRWAWLIRWGAIPLWWKARQGQKGRASF